MKKIFALAVTLIILTALTAPTLAQGRSRRSYYEPAQSSRVYNDNSRVYRDDSQANYDYGYRNPNVWDRHRDKLTLLMGTAGGAAVGGLIGGKRGAVIGAASGLGASALYTYKVRNRRYRY